MCQSNKYEARFKKCIIKAHSSCIYFKSFNFGDRIVDFKSGNPCTNRPVECEASKPHTVVFLSYYLEDHYKQSHPGIDKCSIVVSNEEIDFMKSYKYKDENNDKIKKIKLFE